jgi:S-adenosylmethionine:tRNA ribosyltransferase-isomerase
MFTEIVDLLNEGDLLVLNDTKVMKARLKVNVQVVRR